jgi:phosphatidylglycerophosphatase A
MVRVFSNYWFWALAAIVAVELALSAWFLRARADHHQDIKGPCFDECLGTWLPMMFLGFLLFAWPVVSIVVAAFVRVVFGACVRAWKIINSRPT